MKRSAPELKLKILAYESGISFKNIKEGKLSTEEWQEITVQSARLYEAFQSLGLRLADLFEFEN